MDYNSIAQRALAQIKRAGIAVTISRETAESFDPGTGTYTGATMTDYSADGVIQAPNRENTGGRFGDGTMVQAGDKFILLAASGLTITPKPGDKITVNAVAYSIVTVMAVEPGGVALLYRILART